MLITSDDSEILPSVVERYADGTASAADDTLGMKARVPMLAALRIADEADVETLMEEIVKALRDGGCRLAGFVQRSIDRGDGRGSFLALVDLRDGQETPLSTPRGYAVSDACRACTVDDTVLADFAGRVVRDLDAGVDLLILNRFGRRESEGRGCRDELAAALARETPALCIVRESHVDAWNAFGGDLVGCIEPTVSAVQSWYRDCRLTA